jgi:NAD(P)H-dependent FMN reductase
LTSESPNIFVLATSKSAESRSRLAADVAVTHLRSLGCKVDYFDARHLGYELSGGELADLRTRFAQADGALVAFPIHDWGACPFTRKLLIKAFTDDLRPFRPTGLIAGGGGPRSYLAYGDLALMLTAETNATVVGSAVHAAGDEITPETGEMAEGLRARLISLAQAVAEFSTRS